MLQDQFVCSSVSQITKIGFEWISLDFLDGKTDECLRLMRIIVQIVDLENRRFFQDYELSTRYLHKLWIDLDKITGPVDIGSS